jgi:hypothetical protein
VGMSKEELRKYPKGLIFLWSREKGVIKSIGKNNIIPGEVVKNYCVYPRKLNVREIRCLTKLLEVLE